MQDNEIIELAEALDTFFSTTILEKQLSINTFNGVFMARLVRMNQEVDNMENLNRLLEDILKGDLTKEVVLQ
jgi:hypothetical protein